MGKFVDKKAEAREEKKKEKLELKKAEIKRERLDSNEEDRILASLSGDFIMTIKNETVAAPVVPIVDHKSRGHAPYSGSKIGYTEKCSQYESDNTGDKSAANSGTRVHEAVESGDLSKLDKWEKPLAEYCLAYKKHITKPGSQIHQEYEIEFSKHKQWSYVDLLVINGTHGEVVDWKTGGTQVEAVETNRQGHAYVIGTFKKFPQLETIQMTFVHPRLNVVDATTFTRADAERFEREIDLIIDGAMAGSPPVDGKHCTYCGKKATCPALNNKAVAVLKKYDTSLELPTEMHSSQITDPKDMAKALALATIMGSWVDSVKSHALQLYLSGVSIPGYELSERKGNRKITNPTVAYDLVKDVISVDDFIKCVTVSAASLEEAFAAAAPRGQKAQWKQQLADKLTDADILEQAKPSQFLKASKTK